MDGIPSDHGLTITRLEDLRQAFIQFNTYCTGHVSLKVMSLEDKEVRLLLNEELTAGSHSATLNFGNLAGVYNIRLVVNTVDAIDIDTKPIKID